MAANKELSVDDHALERVEVAGRRSSVKPAFLLILAWVALLGWQVVDHARDASRHREGLEDRGEASLGMLEAAIRSVGRGRRQRPEFLSVVFEEVFSVPGIRGAWLTEPDGKSLYAKSDVDHSPDPARFTGRQWFDEGVMVGRKVDIGVCPFDAEGRPRSAAAMELPSFLFLFVDRSDVDREISTDLMLRILIQAIATLAAAGAFLVIRARARTRRLRTELAVAEERSRRHQEWALLGAGLAHETKNPLAVVRGTAQRLAASEAESPQAAKLAQEIVNEVDRVVARLGEFLHYSRPVEPKLEPVDLRPLLEEMANLAQPDLAPSGGEVSIDGEPASILADRDMLRQILLNLIVNAACAIPAKGRIRLATRVAANGTETLEVKDNGRGVPPEDLEKVFEPYYTRTKKGTGLGLAIVRRLVEAHGWNLELESEPGVQTTFRISGMKQALS